MKKDNHTNQKKGDMNMTIDQATLSKSMEGNRRLTVRTVEAFPAHELFHFAPAEGLRPFSEMIIEILHMELGYMRGIALNEWNFEEPYAGVDSKEGLLEACAEQSRKVQDYWAGITDEKLMEVEQDPFWGGPQSHYERLLYSLENEIHHRGQGYIYLRMLGIEPPAFYER